MKGQIVRDILKPWMSILEIPEELSIVLGSEDIPFVNGCGEEGSFLSIFVPQNIDNIDIRAACLIHDCRYTFGDTLQDKINADIEFENNLKIILAAAEDNLQISTSRRQKRFDQASMFFMFVHLYGEEAFVEGIGNSVNPVSIFIHRIPEKKELERVCSPVGHRGSEDPNDMYL